MLSSNSSNEEQDSNDGRKDDMVHRQKYSYFTIPNIHEVKAPKLEKNDNQIIVKGFKTILSIIQNSNSLHILN